MIAPQDGDFFHFNKPINWKVSVTDHEDKKIDPSRISVATKLVSGSVTNKPETLGLSAGNHSGLSLMKSSDCFNCHAVNNVLVGPTFTAISEKYKDSKKAKPLAAKRILEGSSGVWGQIPMMPHPQHSLADAKQMVDWIFSLSKPAKNSLYGEAGNFKIKKPQGYIEGTPTTLLVEASYLDNGRLPLGPLQGSDLIRLRSTSLKGKSASSHKGLIIGDEAVTHIKHGAFLCYENINLSGISELSLSLASAGTGGSIEVRLHSLQGKIIGQIKFSPNGSWSQYEEQIIAIQPTSERGDIYVRFIKPGSNGGIMNFSHLAFR